MKDWKTNLGLALVIISVAVLVICAFINVGHQIDNPDMTAMRLYMEYPKATNCGLFAAIGIVIGGKLI